jgi:hypothetical protein
LKGETGNDLLHGGGDGDLFIVRTAGGSDEIWDFTPGEDRLDLSSFAFEDAAAVRRLASDAVSGVALELPGGVSVLLRGLDDANALADGDLLL